MVPVQKHRPKEDLIPFLQWSLGSGADAAFFRSVFFIDETGAAGGTAGLGKSDESGAPRVGECPEHFGGASKIVLTSHLDFYCRTVG